LACGEGERQQKSVQSAECKVQSEEQTIRKAEPGTRNGKATDSRRDASAALGMTELCTGGQARQCHPAAPSPPAPSPAEGRGVKNKRGEPGGATGGKRHTPLPRIPTGSLREGSNNKQGRCGDFWKARRFGRTAARFSFLCARGKPSRYIGEGEAGKGSSGGGWKSDKGMCERCAGPRFFWPVFVKMGRMGRVGNG